MKSHSTGPRTQQGKQRSSLNALRHGLTGQTVVIPSDDRQAYDQFIRNFYSDYQPRTAIERQLVQTVADCSWRLNRLRAQEQTLLTLGTIEMESQINNPDDRCATACASGLAFEKHAKTLGNLTLYEQRISRNFDRALKQLKQEQAERKAAEEHQLSRAGTMNSKPSALKHFPTTRPPTSSFFRMTLSTPTPDAKPAITTPTRPPNCVSKPPRLDLRPLS